MTDPGATTDDPFGFELNETEPLGRTALYRAFGRLPTLAAVGIAAVVLLIGLSSIVVARAAKGLIYFDGGRVPAADVVIVPGALVFPGGTPSQMLSSRVDAAVELYHAGRVDHVLVSGDNSEVRYNEPVVMRNRAVDLGVPAADVSLDYAGLDTWDTCIRAREQFGVTSAVVVTQHLYADRTAALCEAAGIHTAVLSLDPPPLQSGTRARGVARETLAKVKAWGDLLRQPDAQYGGPFIGLVGSVNMPEGGHPPDWDWVANTPGGSVPEATVAPASAPAPTPTPGQLIGD